MPQIRFTLLSASGIKDEDSISNNDLYAVIRYGGDKAKSDVAKDGIFQGFKYSWDQTFSFEESSDDDIEVRLFDSDVGFDDFIGKAVFPLGEARANGSAEVSAGVVDKQHEEQGSVKARIEIA